MKKFAFAVAAAASSVALVAGPATAAVTFDPATGTGFVGKGDVQLAMGWNNTQLQKNPTGLTFTSSQPASQALSSSATQSATQDGTQSMLREVSCTIEGKKKTFYNEGSRDGVREGTREGTRTGSRAGSLAGTLSAAVEYEPRVKNQITGFRLKGYTAGPTFGATGDPAWDDAVLGDYTFGDYTFGETEWSGWVAEPGDNPAECLGNNPEITDLSDVTTEGDVVDGDVVDGDISYGPTELGALEATGPAVVSVNGKAMN